MTSMMKSLYTVAVLFAMFSAEPLAQTIQYQYTPTSGNPVYDGNGALIDFDDIYSGFVKAVGCDSVTIRNYTFRYEPKSFCGGRITGYTRHSTSSATVTFKIGLNMPSNIDHINNCTKRTAAFYDLSGRIIEGTSQVYDFSNATVNGDYVTVSLVGSDMPSDMVNNALVLFSRTSAHIGRFEQCGDVVLENITITGTPGVSFSAFSLDSLSASNINTHVIFGLVSTGADIFNLENVRNGVIVQDCSFDGVGDDCINLHVRLMTISSHEDVVAAGDNRKIYAGYPVLNGYQQGDRIIILDKDDTSKLAYANVVEVGNQYIVVDKDLNDYSGHQLYNQDLAFQGTVIDNNEFKDSRRNGIVMRAEGLNSNNRIQITDNTFEWLGARGVVSMSYGIEGARAAWVNIENNTFNHMCQALVNDGYEAAVAMFLNGSWYGHAGVNINNNIFTNNPTHTISLKKAYLFDITGNTGVTSSNVDLVDCLGITGP